MMLGPTVNLTGSRPVPPDTLDAFSAGVEAGRAEPGLRTVERISELHAKWLESFRFHHTRPPVSAPRESYPWDWKVDGT